MTQEESTNNKKPKAIFILILAGLISVYAVVNFRTQSSYENLNEQIDSLQNSIKENQLVIESYDETIKTIKDSITKLDRKVANNNKQIEKLNQEYDQKFDSIASLHSSDLQIYVSKRYGTK